MHRRWVDLKERDHLEDLYLDGRIILKRILSTWNREAWIGLIWFRMGKSGGLL